MLGKIKYIVPVVLLMISCKKNDFLDINHDPNNPTSVPISKLLPTTVKSLGSSLAIGNGGNAGISEILNEYTHQITQRADVDQYGATGNNFFIGTAWPFFYQGTLANLEQIIKDGTTAGNLRYVGIAKILKAFTYSQLVDIFGDIPFSEALKLKEGVKYPKFDDDATIYPQLFTMIDEGIADLSNTSAANVLRPGSDDVIYGGNVTSWIKAANTIKLKLYTQIRKVKTVTTEVTALLNSPATLISATAESFLIPYGPSGATDDRNPAFGDYFAAQRLNFISPWFYEILKGYNPRINTGVVDPRIPYYIYNQLNATQATREGNPTEYRDGPFVSIIFGSAGPNRDHNQQNSISLMGIYPAGGKYDDGSATIATGTSGTGAAPYRLITYADRLYLEAELINTGVITGDARAKLKAAIEESFKQVDYVVTKTGTSGVPVLAGTTAVTNYVNAMLAQYDAGDNNRKLEIIMTQKWISAFGSHIDEYTDYRRTGYPIFFNPNDPTMAPGGRVQPPINGDPSNPGAQASVPVQLSRPYPLSLPWLTPELNTNPNAPPQKNQSTYKVFWMP
ncbi:MAG TPA: SusD/RagB family nutrient-binding outer membrane lipoprotein [Chitinophagaceae bacterium]|jgi:hypothetical protein|nr:SusD/RagB family nutrient-binding outer membrane lipoprotein [Chitinophagaceae bacterium]